jgi:ABC-type glycerol-3-phosphate transport system substrate-binding protein
MKQWTLLLALLLVLAVVVLACAPSAEPGGLIEEPLPEEPAAVEEEVSATEPVEAIEQPVSEPTREVISFWTWASTDFEYDALEQMVQQFREDTGVEVELLIIR